MTKRERKYVTASRDVIVKNEGSRFPKDFLIEAMGKNVVFHRISLKIAKNIFFPDLFLPLCVPKVVIGQIPKSVIFVGGKDVAVFIKGKGETRGESENIWMNLLYFMA